MLLQRKVTRSLSISYSFTQGDFSQVGYLYSDGVLDLHCTYQAADLGQRTNGTHKGMYAKKSRISIFISGSGNRFMKDSGLLAWLCAFVGRPTDEPIRALPL